MNPYAGMLFLEGHLVDPELARSLAGPEPEADDSAGTGQAPCEQPGLRPGAIVSVCGGVALSLFR